jgi:hypothetical protein
MRLLYLIIKLLGRDHSPTSVTQPAAKVFNSGVQHKQLHSYAPFLFASLMRSVALELRV